MGQKPTNHHGRKSAVVRFGPKATIRGTSRYNTCGGLMAVGGWANQASIRPYLVQTMEQAATFQAKRDAYRRRIR